MSSDATKRARRSDSLYYSGMTRRGLCDRISILESELDVQKQREEYWHSVAEVLGGTCEAVLKRRHAGEATEDVSDRL